MVIIICVLFRIVGILCIVGWKKMVLGFNCFDGLYILYMFFDFLMGIFNFKVVDFFVLCKGFGCLYCWGFWIWFCNCLSCVLVFLFIFFVFNSFLVNLNFLLVYKNFIVILWFVVIFWSFIKYCFCFFRKILLGILSVDKSMMYCLFK